jgi:hypothetical protein
MRSLIGTAFTAGLLLFSNACGGDDDPAGPGGGGVPGTMTARVDGQSWTATMINRGRSGTQMVISGTAQGVTINLQVSNPAPGTITLEPGNLTNLNVAQGTQGWVASAGTGSGSITFTTLTDTRAVGSFAFTGELIMGSGPPATRQVTEGAFDIVF